MTNTNPCIFNEHHTVETYYQQIVELPSEIRAQVNDFLRNHLNEPRRIIDIGCGRGDLSIPLLSSLYEQNQSFSYYGFDISEEMIGYFRKQLNLLPVKLGEKTHLNVADAAAELQRKGMDSKKFEMAVLTFVLHYFENWKDILKKIKNILSVDGNLIQCAALGYYGWLAGLFDCREGIPEEHLDFWKEYFRKKNEVTGSGVWKNYFDLIYLSDVRSYLTNELDMVLIDSLKLIWYKPISFTVLLSWIEHSPVSTIGGGLDQAQRLSLRNEMENWLLKMGLSITKEYKIPFSWEIFSHGKQRVPN